VKLSTVEICIIKSKPAPLPTAPTVAPKNLLLAAVGDILYLMILPLCGFAHMGAKGRFLKA
jgi:hypothetical protein